MKRPANRCLSALRLACLLLPQEIREEQFSEWRDEIQCADEHGLSSGRRTLSIVLRSIPRLAWRARRPGRLRSGWLELAGGLRRRLPKSIQGSWAFTAGRTAWAKTLAVALAVALVDLGSKAWVSGSLALLEKQHPLPHLTVWHLQNPGLSLTFLDGGIYIPVYVVAVAGALMFLWFVASPPQPRLWLIVGLLVGGITGNVAERVYHDYVTDFLQVDGFRPVFNVADASIALAMLVTILPHRRRPKSSAGQEYERFVAGNSLS
jgi:signal peptidase II